MAQARSLRNRKRQTRLEFQPISSSSPAKDVYSQAVQDRLANVRYEGARKRSKAHVRQIEDDEQSLPTPQPTSPAEDSVQVPVPTSPLSSLQTSPPLPPRFVDPEKESISGDDDILPPSSKRRRLLDFRNDLKMGNTISAEDAVSPSIRTRPQSTNLHTEIDEQTLSTPARRSSRIARTKPSHLPPDLSSPSRSFVSVVIPTPSKRLSDLASAESSDDDVMATQPLTRKREASKKSQKKDDFVVEDDEVEFIPSEDEVAPEKQRPKRRRDPDDFVVDNDEVEYISSNEENTRELTPSKAKKSSQQQRSPPERKRRRKRLQREQEELEEDLLDLQDSDQEKSARTSRTRGGPVTTQRDKTKNHFEQLKRRRAGERAPRVIASDDELDSEDDEVADIDEIGNEPSRIEIISDESTSHGGEQEQDLGLYPDDEDDFVVEDQVSTGRLGRPNTDIPLEFTSFASAKPRELFPHIIEWMVKNKTSPAFNRNDGVYNVSFARVDDQVKAQAGSRLISSAWNSTFKWVILARPDIRVTALPGLDEDLIRTCDACNKTNHPARYDFTFSGKAYSKETLEPINDSDDEDEDEDGNADNDDDDDDKASYDEQGHLLARQNMHFYLGRFCAANAEMGHKLTHWKHHLNEQVLSYLEEQGVLSAEAIVGREKLNKKKREKEAESIVDMMQETGMIAELWQSFQDDLEDARIGMEGHERKGGRSKGRIGSVRVQRDNGAIGEWVDGGKFRQVAARLESDSEGE